jgi:hypothetical protein
VHRDLARARRVGLGVQRDRAEPRFAPGARGRLVSLARHARAEQGQALARLARGALGDEEGGLLAHRRRAAVAKARAGEGLGPLGAQAKATEGAMHDERGRARRRPEAGLEPELEGLARPFEHALAKRPIELAERRSERRGT